MDDLPPEAYDVEAGRHRLAVPLRGFFAPPAAGETEDEGAMLRANSFSDLGQSIASACTGLPGVVPDRRIALSPQRPADGTWIASVRELVKPPDPATVGLETLGAVWWQGVVGAERAEIALRAGGELLGFVVQDVP